MTRCWNCGLPDVAERCPRCGAPQERRGPPPPAAPPTGQSGGLRQRPEFIVNGVPVDPRASNYPSGPLPPQGQRPPGYPSGPLPPERLPGRTSGPLPPEPRAPSRTSGPLSPGSRSPYPSGPLPPERLPGRTSGPLPPDGGYRQTRPAPEGWEEERALPPEPPRGSGLLSRRESAPLNHVQPEYAAQNHYRAPSPQRPPVQPQGSWDEAPPTASPYGVSPGRGASRPMPQNGWDNQYRQPLDASQEQEVVEPPPHPPEKAARSRTPERAPSMSYAVWDDERPEWDEPEFLTLSGMVNALIGAAIGGLFGAMIWVGVTFAFGRPFPYLTVVVGLLAGLGARFTLEQTRPWSLGIFAAIGALLGFVVAQYGLFDYALAAAQARQGIFSSWFPLSPLQFLGVYWDYLINVADEINSQLGQLGPHPEAYVEMLACVAVCWSLLIRKKR